jgi:hypothetical protein
VHNESGSSLVDARFGPDVADHLRSLGHSIEVVTSRFAQPGWARINGILFSDTGEVTSGVDPFGDGGAAAPA